MKWFKESKLINKIEEATEFYENQLEGFLERLRELRLRLDYAHRWEKESIYSKINEVENEMEKTREIIRKYKDDSERLKKDQNSLEAELESKEEEGILDPESREKLENQIQHYAFHWFREATIMVKKKTGKDFFGRVEKGYKNKFGINAHHGQQYHFDLRLLIPDGDLSLYYYLEGPEDVSEEEKRERLKKKDLYPKKSYVSFAISKHKFPSKKEKLLMNRTADHPQDYMEGSIGEKTVIPEGHYGAGYYTIYDKGDFTVLDVDPKRMVVYFNGQKIKGAYAIVYSPRRTGQEFLLVKLTEQDPKKLEEEYKVKI